MTHTPRGPQTTNLLHALCEQIERTWNQHRDATRVDQLAAEHPALAEALYEHFALIMEAELGPDEEDPTLAALDANARRWLESGGYAHVAEVARESGSRAAPSGPEIPPTSMAPPAPSPAAGLPAAGAVASGSGEVGGAGDATSTRPRPRRRPVRRTFLGLLTDATGAAPAEIAERLGVNANFLVGVDDLGDRLPGGARDELARRAEARYGVAHATGLARLTEAAALPMAASRRASYGVRLTYPDLVRRSGLPPAEEAFWLALADADAPPTG